MHHFSDEATAYFNAHLADDPATQKMLSRLDMVADELEAAGLESVIDAAKFARAINNTKAGSCAELPFDLPEPICQIIDGSKTKGATTKHCSTPEARHAATVLNTVRRISRQKPGYAWAEEVLRQSPLKTHAQISLSVVDDELAGVSLALDHELRLLPRLETQQALDSDKEYEAIAVAALAIFWAEEDGIHCGVTERYGARWARVVDFARRRGYPIYKGFQGEALDDEQLDEVLEAIEAPSAGG